MWRSKRCSVVTLSWTAGACSVSFVQSFFLSLNSSLSWVACLQRQRRDWLHGVLQKSRFHRLQQIRACRTSGRISLRRRGAGRARVVPRLEEAEKQLTFSLGGRFSSWTTLEAPAVPAHFTSGHADHVANLTPPRSLLFAISGA